MSSGSFKIIIYIYMCVCVCVCVCVCEEYLELYDPQGLICHKEIRDAMISLQAF